MQTHPGHACHGLYTQFVLDDSLTLTFNRLILGPLDAERLS